MEVFKEAALPLSFAKKQHSIAKQWIKSGQSFTIIGINSVGVSPFLKFLASQPYAFFIHLDTYELSEFTTQALIELLWYKLTDEKKRNVTLQDCKIVCLEKAKQNRLVIIVNKFDLLHTEFSQTFFGNLRTLCHGTNGQVSFIFSVTKPFIEYNPEAVSGSNMHIFSRYLSFSPYNEADVYELLKLHSPEHLQRKDLQPLIKKSDGHMQLLHLMLRSEMPSNLLLDPYIKLLFKTILNDLTSYQQKLLKKIAANKAVEPDLFLEHIGVIKKVANKYSLFTPLLVQYLRQENNQHLPPKEKKLFQLLKTSPDRIISKNKIFETLWENGEETTDWALDSIVYRLRKHSLLKEHGYVIKSYKKVGYQLVREK